ncbi:hypothetical protein ABPG74_019326 [Tetrahymena malaccensis]
MLSQQQKKYVKGISKKLSKGYPFSKIDFDTFFSKMQQQNPFTDIQDYFNDQLQLLVLKTRTAKINKDITTKFLDCLYEQLSDSIYIMKKEFEQLVIQKCQKLIAKINQQNPQIQNRDHSDYRAQFQVLKFETSLENNDITSISLNYTNEKLKHGIDAMLKEHDNTIGYLTKVWFYHYQTDEFETKKIGMDKIKILTKKA